MPFTPYLSFDGTCADALEFYAEVFGGETRNVQTVANSPMAEQFSAGQQALVIHGEVHLDTWCLMGSDSLMAPYEPPRGFHVQMTYSDPDRAKRVFDRLARHGHVQMAFAPTFFAPGFGLCTDRFAVPWMILCDQTAESH